MEELHAKPNKTLADLQQMEQYARENQAFRDKYGIPSDDLIAILSYKE